MGRSEIEKCSSRPLCPHLLPSTVLYTLSMKHTLILLAALSLFSSNALADAMEVKTLSCQAYNLMGQSSFELPESSDEMTTSTFSTFGFTTSTYKYTGVDMESTFGTTNIPFSKITFISSDGASYALVFTEPMREGQSTYKGTWGKVNALSPFGGPVGFTIIASVSCTVEVVEQPY